MKLSEGSGFDGGKLDVEVVSNMKRTVLAINLLDDSGAIFIYMKQVVAAFSFDPDRMCFISVTFGPALGDGCCHALKAVQKRDCGWGQRRGGTTLAYHSLRS